MNESNVSPVVVMAKAAKDGDSSAIKMSSTGYRIKIVPVASSLLDEVSSQFEDPEIPVYHNDEKGRDEPNPNDPRYLAALAKAERARGIAALDAMIMFGVELVDPMPDINTWLVKLKRMEKMGLLRLEDYDLTDPVDVEFLFKRYVVVANQEMVLLTKASSMSAAEVDKAEKQFQGNS